MNLKMPKFGVLVSADRFSVVSVSFCCDSLRELHVFLPFLSFGHFDHEKNLTGISVAK